MPSGILKLDKLLSASKRIIRYVALYSMAGVAMENRLFGIAPNARDMPFLDACVAFLHPKMHLSRVMPSGCNLRRVAVSPNKELALPDRPSVSDFQEEQGEVDPADMQIALATPVFQPYRGATGRAWIEKEYGIVADTSSLLSLASGTEREDTDNEMCSFDLGPEPFDPTEQDRLPSDEWLDDHQQGLIPEGSEPSHKDLDYTKYLAMPRKPSILDMMRQDIDDSDEVPQPSTERALTPTIDFSYDYAQDEPPDIQRVVDVPRHLTPYPDPPTLSARPGPILLPPRRALHQSHRQKLSHRPFRLRAHPLLIARRIRRRSHQSTIQEEVGVAASGAPLRNLPPAWEPEARLD